MHEILLFASIPASQHTHILRILAGLSAMQPLPLRDCHLLFKPARTSGSLQTSIPGRPPAQSSVKPGSTNAFTGSGAASQLSNDLFYLQLVGDFMRSRSSGTGEGEREGLVEGGERVGDLQGEDGMDVDGVEQGTSSAATTGVEKDSEETKLWNSHPWTLNYAAVPDVPGKRTATSRLISTIPLLDGNPRAFLHGLGYVYVTGYVVAGHRFTHNHLSITLCRTFPLDETTEKEEGKGGEIPVTRISSLGLNDGTDSGGSMLDGLQPLDASGGYLLQVSARVSDGSKPELMNKAFAELAAFRDTLRGVVSLQPVERLGLDTRVRSDKIAAQAQIRSAAVVR